MTTTPAPCPVCGYPAAVPSGHTTPADCIGFLQRSLAARSAALEQCGDHVRGLQYQLGRWMDVAAARQREVTR